MSVIRLPADTAALSTHFDRILADAHHHQLGETVTLAIADDEVVAIDFATHTICLNFVQAVPDIPVFEVNTYWVCDQWPSQPLSVSEAQQRVINNPQLVLCGLPTEHGLLDIWHHNGEARALHCERGGDDTAFRAMLMASLAVDYPLEDAVTLARGYARQYEVNGTLGWPLKRDVFPRPLTANHPQVSALGWHSKEVAVAPFAKTDAAKLALYPVVDTAEWVTRLLALGVTTTQLRIKDPHAPDLEQQVQTIIAAGEDHQAQVFVNDYWQLAIAHRAYGVHLGQEDLETADLAQIQQAGLRLGLSTHGYYEILRAAEFSPSYIALGHIYPTTTKDMPSKPQGLSRLALYQQLIGHDFPTVAIGGIDLSRAQAVWQTGVSSVAVVRAVTQAPDTQAALAAFNQTLVR